VKAGPPSARGLEEDADVTDPEEIRRGVAVCMFDQYGTVVDMQAGLREVAADFLRAKGWGGDPNAFVTWWRRTHFENSMVDALLGRGHTPYREIGHLSVAQVMDRAAIPHTEEEVRHLVSCIERLKPFPEVPAALDRLRARYRLVILSNGDPDMLEAARLHHGIAFERVISVAEAGGAFKPHRATYTRAAELVGARMDQVVFVANHEFDVVGAKAAGMRAAFIDRRRRPFARWPHQPDLVLPSMTALADAIA
jgi:2-haloacid dehalogenase